MKTIEKVVFDNGVILEKEDMLSLWVLLKHLLKVKVSGRTYERRFNKLILLDHLEKEKLISKYFGY
jgi:hypothetical protein